MNRFANRTIDNNYGNKKITKYIPLFLGLFIVVLFLYGVNFVSASSIDKQQESLENAISRDVAQCYSIEGTYPPSLDYIKEHYGLIYNESLFFVDYQPIASNIFPDITIIRLKDKE